MKDNLSLFIHAAKLTQKLSLHKFFYNFRVFVATFVASSNTTPTGSVKISTLLVPIM